MKKIAVIEGDGIGREVIPQALKVLNALEFEFEKIELNVGYSRWETTGEAISNDDINTLKECDCILFGAITTPNDPDYKSVLLRIRKELELYANVRPIRPIAAITGAVGHKNFDLVIVRENTECLYAGLEEIYEDRAYTTRVITRNGSERVAKYACKLANARRKHLTIVHKSNVIKSDKLFLETCQEIADKEKINFDDRLVDSMAFSLITEPWKYDVVVTTNMFGDILSDLSGALVGSLGLLPSANIGLNQAFFEPVHGSAPDIAGENKANPIAAILSTKMMLEWCQEFEKASMIEEAINQTLCRNIRTPDIGGHSTTDAFGDAVAEYIKDTISSNSK
ncbi:isocitrate/isopropylmalate dehydrogenase family protein [Methanosalsum natronophilum]|uniref:isocitrate/isopropylmalate dehydrogenase family protein n=1 Tax=Methanosalsum natronophilum TaxID=768733 RepID=UPI00216A6C53|nr:isocitrate/isopropylmalate dehydrogenase family protein [Methanosalsum natronophilum]MCS3923699.1 methanogen homoisocitrate dehydrogenase [Methanosalsum natronophilum]